MRARILVLLLFFVSGTLGLIYEVVWARQLSMIFGISVFATSTVLAVYMAGLALGSVWVGRFIDRSPNPVRVYALLEGGIGLTALAMPFALHAVRDLYLLASGPLEGRRLLAGSRTGAREEHVHRGRPTPTPTPLRRRGAWSC
jgi:predicted membrane-bound spermidine synthase